MTARSSGSNPGIALSNLSSRKARSERNRRSVRLLGHRASVWLASRTAHTVTLRSKQFESDWRYCGSRNAQILMSASPQNKTANTKFEPSWKRPRASDWP